MRSAMVNAKCRTQEIDNLFGQTEHENLNTMLHMTKYLMGGPDSRIWEWEKMGGSWNDEESIHKETGLGLVRGGWGEGLPIMAC